MSRSDQWIGLTQAAKDFLDQLETAGALIGEYKMCQAAFELDGSGNTAWYYGSFYKLGPLRFREVLQDEIWSGGPMYFTCLQEENKKGKSIRKLFQWRPDRKLAEKHLEYDPVKGTYWI